MAVMANVNTEGSQSQLGVHEQRIARASDIRQRRAYEQRMAALALANDIRQRRAQLKRDLAAGRREFCDVLLSPPDWLHGASVYEFLLAVPRVGRRKAGKIIAERRTTTTKTFGGLTQRQRQEFRDALVRGHYPWSRERALDELGDELREWDPVVA